jgi:hypothetical protein
MSSVNPYYTRQFEPLTEDPAREFRVNEGADHPAANEPTHKRPAGSARWLALYFTTALLALAGASIHFWPQIVAFFEEIL